MNIEKVHPMRRPRMRAGKIRGVCFRPVGSFPSAVEYAQSIVYPHFFIDALAKVHHVCHTDRVAPFAVLSKQRIELYQNENPNEWRYWTETRREPIQQPVYKDILNPSELWTKGITEEYIGVYVHLRGARKRVRAKQLRVAAKLMRITESWYDQPLIYVGYDKLNPIGAWSLAQCWDWYEFTCQYAKSGSI